MKLKEKCIYYNRSKKGYYLIISISDMVYGRYGDMINPSYMDRYMNQDGTGLRFKIDDIIINRDYIHNYSLDENDLDELEFVKELTDDEFYPIELITNSNFAFPDTVIDVHKHMDGVSDIIKNLKHKKSEKEKLVKDIRKLELQLFYAMVQ